MRAGTSRPDLLVRVRVVVGVRVGADDVVGQVVVGNVGAVAASGLGSCGAVGLAGPGFPAAVRVSHDAEGVVENGAGLTAAWKQSRDVSLPSCGGRCRERRHYL